MIHGQRLMVEKDCGRLLKGPFRRSLVYQHPVVLNMMPHRKGETLRRSKIVLFVGFIGDVLVQACMKIFEASKNATSLAVSTKKIMKCSLDPMRSVKSDLKHVSMHVIFAVGHAKLSLALWKLHDITLLCSKLWKLVGSG